MASDYSELSRRIKHAGLLRRRSAYYAAKIASTAVLLAAGWTAFLLLGDSWWQLVTAVFLAFAFTQIAFLGHDAGHRQIFGTRRANGLVGLVLGNLLIGVSYTWWVGKHNRHHSNPNHADLDPDVTIGALAFTALTPWMLKRAIDAGIAGTRRSPALCRAGAIAVGKTARYTSHGQPWIESDSTPPCASAGGARTRTIAHVVSAASWVGSMRATSRRTRTFSPPKHRPARSESRTPPRRSSPPAPESPWESRTSAAA